MNKYIEVEAANGKKATCTTLSWSVSNNNNSISLANGVVSSVYNGGYGKPVIKVETVDGPSGTITIPVYEFDLMYNNGVVTGKTNKWSGAGAGRNTYTVSIAINGETLSSSSNSALKNLASYGWNCSKSSGTTGVHDFTDNTYDATLSLGWDAAGYLIKATIKVNSAEVANISCWRES